MLPGAGMIQMTGEIVSTPEITHICESLDNHGIRFLSLRDCKVGDKEFKRLTKALGQCKSVLQLNLSLGLVYDRFRIELVAQSIVRNRSLRVVSLHGNSLGDEGVFVICQALAQHPHITSLDLGDCAFGDVGLEAVCDLLPPSGGKPGLHELTLSANTDITARGWAKLSMAVGASSMLKALYLDYNTLGDYGAGCLAVSLAANRRIEILDLEGTGITEHSAKLFLHLVKSYPVKLKRLVLSENRVHRSTVEAIRTCLQDFEDVDNSEPEDPVIGQSHEETGVRQAERRSSDQTDTDQVLSNLAQLMNTPDRKRDKRRNRRRASRSDENIEADRMSVDYRTPTTSNHLPQTSGRSAGDPRGNPLTETEVWGEELDEVPVSSPGSSHHSWVSFKKH